MATVTIDVEELARAVLLKIIPDGYRLAGRSDARFTEFSQETQRIALRHLGPRPSLIAFCGPGQDTALVARAAAKWMAANFRPNAIQRRVQPGVLVIGVEAPGELPAPAELKDLPVEASIWTVDATSGQLTARSHPSGAPSPGVVGSAARGLIQGREAPPVGALDHAERELMNPRRRYRYAGPSGVVGVILLLVGLRYGAALLYGLALNPVTAIGEIVVVVGLGGAALLYFDIWGLRSRLPGFSSSRRGVVAASWSAYLGAFAVLALVFNVVLPSLLPAVQGGCSVPGCTVTAADDKAAVVVTTDAILTVDLSEAPKAAWPDMRIESSDPTILEKLAQGSRSGDPPAARFRALTPGSARIRAISDAGGYSFEITVDVRPRTRAS